MTTLREFIAIDSDNRASAHYTEVAPGEFIIHSLGMALSWIQVEGETFAESVRRYHREKGGYSMSTFEEMHDAYFIVAEVTR